MSVGCAVSQHVRMRQCSTVELSLRYAYILYAESAHPLYLGIIAKVRRSPPNEQNSFGGRGLELKSHCGLHSACTIKTGCYIEAWLAIYCSFEGGGGRAPN